MAEFANEKYAADLQLVRKIGKAADAVSMARFLAQDLIIETKPDASPVTDADKATEKCIREILESERPNDGILGEEFGADITGKNRYWVIDPIDGTKSFLRGLPVWSTLIALVEVTNNSGVEKHEVVVGLVSSPALARTWFATKGGGAYTTFDSPSAPNSGQPRKISVSLVNNIHDAHLGYSDFVGFGDRLAAFQSLVNEAWRTRAVGDFWSHMLVAEGVMDLAIEPSLALWDMAPLAIVVREAGGHFFDLEGNDGPFGKSGISTNAALKEVVLKRLNG
ncbi:MAG: inositol monophosphatase family protein [Candidatus Nanopelagicaceae bacterium]